jgi:broad specificity phosphatase PhoE
LAELYKAWTEWHMSKALYFIRHCESVSNAGGMTMEHGSIPLSGRGKHQAQIVAETLDVKPSQVLVSELIRTQQTAQPFCDKIESTIR